MGVRLKTTMRWQQQAFLKQKARAKRNCEKVARAISKRIKQRINRYWGGIPSAPGEPPRRRTGTLHDSVSVRTIERGLKEVTWRVTTVYYGDYLEQGTSKMAARPFMESTFLQIQHRLIAILKEP